MERERCVDPRMPDTMALSLSFSLALQLKGATIRDQKVFRAKMLSPKLQKKIERPSPLTGRTLHWHTSHLVSDFVFFVS